jgi:transposase-like protein
VFSDSQVKKNGFFYRSSDRKSVQRYHCSVCKMNFSSATFSDCLNQKKRHLNSKVSRLLSGAVAIRETARVLKINRKTVARKLTFMGLRAKQELVKFNNNKPIAKEVLFDDMETFEHTKCKPLSIGLMVEEGSRRILGYNVARMPAKGLLAKISVRKYGRRIDERPKKRAELFTQMKSLVEQSAIVKSDQCPYYFKYIQRHFPRAKHVTFKGRASAIVGQGELKKVGFDPLFSLNHTCATLRARVSRLIRRTWNTTKKPERLDLHLAIVCLHHNRNLKSYRPNLATG